MQILILGMHRSGTSLVARLLNMMGVYFAPEGVSTDANQENPKGFWERSDVRALNDMLLHAAGADWHRLSGFSLEKVPESSLAQFKREAAKIILNMDAHRPWLLKEPRLCVLAPLWLELLEVPTCVLVNRSPLEVARSLEMRNGFSYSFSLALWERYNTAALNATREHRRIQVSHADLLTDPVGTTRQVQEKLEQMGVHGLSAPSDEEIRAFIDPSLYRAKGKQIRARLSPAQRRLGDGFQQETILRSQKAIHFSAESQEVLSQHDESVAAQETIAGLEKRNALLMSEGADLKNKLKQSQKELQKTHVMGAQLQNELRENKAAGTRVEDKLQKHKLVGDLLYKELQETKIAEAHLQREVKDARVVKSKILEGLSFRRVASAKHALPLPPMPALGDCSICCIVLHRSGEHHLQNLFSSFLSVNTLKVVEFRVILHACTDGSREVIGSFQNRLRIEVTDCQENQSFAYSNNRAAEATNAEYLIFLNNDIVFQEDVVPELLRCLQDPRNGMAGIRLVFPPDDMTTLSALQHAGIKFRSDPKHFFYRPFNLGMQDFVPDTPRVLEKFPAVTAAMVACRRSEFLAVGGFCEKFSYGYEDVDLCLSMRRLLGLRSVSANHVSCMHDESATRRLSQRGEQEQRGLNNIGHVARRHGWYLRRQIMSDKVSGRLFFSDQPLTVAFAVTESSRLAAAGDFFTASELADACQHEFGWRIRYLSRQNDWYDLRGVDVLVALLDSYELSKIRDAKPDLIKVAWLRNWFERWVSRPGFDQYDLYLCSSTKSAQWLREVHRKPAWVFPLATNPHSFAQGRPDSSFSSDYCFTGSCWQAEREIETALQPQKLDGYKFAVFGKNWEAHPTLGAYARGFRPYSDMPAVYASTRVVADDANSVTKEWGSVNSRVFDALAAGALVITNGQTGATELFDKQLPTYGSPEELESLLRHYLQNEEERQKLVVQLQERVFTQHTYRHRARTLKRILIDRARRGYRIALKIGAPSLQEAPHWGDYHFARSLGRCFAAKGHSFRIDCLDEWERPETFGDDVVIVLRGLSRYRPKPGQINLMWNISHPDKIDDQEYEEFDHVFVASETYAAELAARPGISVSALLQCTDPETFFPDPNPDVPEEKLLFVGNSRKQYREIVRFAVEAGLPLGVYGTHWPMFISANYIRGEYIDNGILRQYYSRCDILLNDHWPSMRERGFISNRLFDGAASGAFIISDWVEGGVEVFGDDLVTYQGPSDFREQVRYYLSHPEERRVRAERLRARVFSAHTFACRAEALLAKIKEIDRRNRGIEKLSVHPPEGLVAEATVAAKI